jgi:hypothetical protein
VDNQVLRLIAEQGTEINDQRRQPIAKRLFLELEVYATVCISGSFSNDPMAGH